MTYDLMSIIALALSLIALGVSLVNAVVDVPDHVHTQYVETEQDRLDRLNPLMDDHESGECRQACCRDHENGE
jgi:hypothetical protein